MSQAVWTLIYAVSADDRARYLDWFHDVHIPDKLARPGYTWAAHYEQSEASDGLRGYVAMFGGESSRVFHDPSPAQLKTRQDALTREMMGCRVGGRGIVHVEEWCQDGAAGRCAPGSPVDAPVIRLACMDAQGGDEALEAWCAQQHFPAIGAADGCLGVRKWLAASGAPRHAVLQSFTALAPCSAANGAPPTAWGAEIAEALDEPLGPPRVAVRLWPQP